MVNGKSMLPFTHIFTAVPILPLPGSIGWVVPRIVFIGQVVLFYIGYVLISCVYRYVYLLIFGSNLPFDLWWKS